MSPVSKLLIRSLNHAAQRDPKGFSDTILSAANSTPTLTLLLNTQAPPIHDMCARMAQARSPIISANPLEVGELVKDRGVYLGKYAGLAAYAAEDFLRDENGKQLVLNFNDARDELTRRNNGKSYGNGTEKALRQAIEDGSYRDGDLVVPPRELLDGRNFDGDKVRPGENVIELLGKTAFSKIKATISNVKDDPWAVSSSELPDYPSHVAHVSLSDGVYAWNFKNRCRSGVVPVRLYRDGPEAPKLTPGG